MPARKLPYRSVMVASSNDPYCPVRLAGAYARAWGSEFVRIQNRGRINIESGHGAWPLGAALLQSLAGVCGGGGGDLSLTKKRDSAHMDVGRYPTKPASNPQGKFIQSCRFRP